MDAATYTGRWLQEGKVAAFLGVPFAASPDGDRRWMPPQPLAPTGEHSATNYAAACMQGPHMVDWYRDLVSRFDGDPEAFPIPSFSEDCLYLNVWTPALERDAGLPVMVWIHGGGHKGGWSYEPDYVGDRLSSSGVVVVSIAYRLDIFGFFSHPDLRQSNFGLLDQIAALEWVQAHIDRFGGDPDNVTVFGESAGAASASYLLASPLAAGLFRRLVHQSAGYELRHRDRRENFLDEGRELERRVLQDAQAGIVALRAAPPEPLLEAAGDVYAEYQPDAVIDGHSLTDAPMDLLEDGDLTPVDVILGSNADEWKMYLDADTAREDVDRWLLENAVGDEVGRTIMADDETPLRQLDRLITAQQFVCPSLALADYMAASGKSSYVYYFSRNRPGRQAGTVGAYHGIEIPYVFDNHGDWLPIAQPDRDITKAMTGYWTAFALTGNPNGDDRPAWPRWNAESALALGIGDRIRQVEHPETLLCERLSGTEVASPP